MKTETFGFDHVNCNLFTGYETVRDDRGRSIQDHHVALKLVTQPGSTSIFRTAIVRSRKRVITSDADEIDK